MQEYGAACFARSTALAVAAAARAAADAKAQTLITPGARQRHSAAALQAHTNALAAADAALDAVCAPTLQAAIELRARAAPEAGASATRQAVNRSALRSARRPGQSATRAPRRRVSGHRPPGARHITCGVRGARGERRTVRGGPRPLRTSHPTCAILARRHGWVAARGDDGNGRGRARRPGAAFRQRHHRRRARGGAGPPAAGHRHRRHGACAGLESSLVVASFVERDHTLQRSFAAGDGAFTRARNPPLARGPICPRSTWSCCAFASLRTFNRGARQLRGAAERHQELRG